MTAPAPRAVRACRLALRSSGTVYDEVVAFYELLLLPFWQTWYRTHHV